MGDTRKVLHGWLRRALVLVPLLALALAGCASDAPQDTFKPEGPQARHIDNLIIPVFAVAGVVFVVILAGCLYIALKFRARDDDDYDDMPKQIHGNVKAEIGWTIIPALILVGVAVPTVVGVFKLNEDPPPDALHVEVIGQQWWWEYRYDIDDDGQFDDIVTANDLVIPAGREVALTITARDVIHSFWVPRLNGKRDAVPNRDHPWKLEADEPGEFLGQCTEYCGLSHAEMRIKAIALTEDDFAELGRAAAGRRGDVPRRTTPRTRPRATACSSASSARAATSSRASTTTSSAGRGSRTRGRSRIRSSRCRGTPRTSPT